jgi:hypothetical protein
MKKATKNDAIFYLGKIEKNLSHVDRVDTKFRELITKWHENKFYVGKFRVRLI